jgi:cytochrome c peroxidase
MLRTPPPGFLAAALAVAAAALSSTASLAATTPQEQLAAYTLAAQASGASSPANTQRGEAFFTSRHGREWSCSTCHGVVPTQDGTHTVTGKSISPMAPAFNAKRFTDADKTEKWFRRNCNDVIGRECTASEKADLIRWLLALKP